LVYHFALVFLVPNFLYSNEFSHRHLEQGSYFDFDSPWPDNIKI